MLKNTPGSSNCTGTPATKKTQNTPYPSEVLGQTVQRSAPPRTQNSRFVDHAVRTARSTFPDCRFLSAAPSLSTTEGPVDPAREPLGGEADGADLVGEQAGLEQAEERVREVVGVDIRPPARGLGQEHGDHLALPEVGADLAPDGPGRLGGDAEQVEVLDGEAKERAEHGPQAGLGVSVASDQVVYQSDVYAASRSNQGSPRRHGHARAGWGDRAVLILIGIRVGLDGVNPIYYDTIKVSLLLFLLYARSASLTYVSPS